MAVGTPQRIPAGTLQKLRKQLRTIHVDRLTEVLLEDGLLEREDGRLVWKTDAYNDLWGRWCLIWATPLAACNELGEIQYNIRCTCWAFAWRGHCVHAYAAEDYWGYKSHAPARIPPVPVPGSKKRSRSEEAQNPRVRR